MMEGAHTKTSTLTNPESHVAVQPLTPRVHAAAIATTAPHKNSIFFPFCVDAGITRVLCNAFHYLIRRQAPPNICYRVE